MGDANNPMILSPENAYRFADKFIDYFSNTGRIDEYLLNVKADRMSQMYLAAFGMGPEDDLFSDFE